MNRIFIKSQKIFLLAFLMFSVFQVNVSTHQTSPYTFSAEEIDVEDETAEEQNSGEKADDEWDPEAKELYKNAKNQNTQKDWDGFNALTSSNIKSSLPGYMDNKLREIGWWLMNLCIDVLDGIQNALSTIFTINLFDETSSHAREIGTPKMYKQAQTIGTAIAVLATVFTAFKLFPPKKGGSGSEKIYEVLSKVMLVFVVILILPTVVTYVNGTIGKSVGSSVNDLNNGTQIASENIVDLKNTVKNRKTVYVSDLKKNDKDIERIVKSGEDIEWNAADIKNSTDDYKEKGGKWRGVSDKVYYIDPETEDLRYYTQSNGFQGIFDNEFYRYSPNFLSIFLTLIPLIYGYLGVLFKVAKEYLFELLIGIIALMAYFIPTARSKEKIWDMLLDLLNILVNIFLQLMFLYIFTKIIKVVLDGDFGVLVKAVIIISGVIVMVNGSTLMNKWFGNGASSSPHGSLMAAAGVGGTAYAGGRMIGGTAGNSAKIVGGTGATASSSLKNSFRGNDNLDEARNTNGINKSALKNANPMTKATQKSALKNGNSAESGEKALHSSGQDKTKEENLQDSAMANQNRGANQDGAISNEDEARIASEIEKSRGSSTARGSREEAQKVKDDEARLQQQVQNESRNKNNVSVARENKNLKPTTEASVSDAVKQNKQNTFQQSITAGRNAKGGDNVVK